MPFFCLKQHNRTETAVSPHGVLLGVLVSDWHVVAVSSRTAAEAQDLVGRARPHKIPLRHRRDWQEGAEGYNGNMRVGGGGGHSI